MKMFFKTRTAVRAFSAANGRKPTDEGAAAPAGRRWAIDVDAPKAA